MIRYCSLHHPYAVRGPLNSLQGSESCCWTGPPLDLLHPISLENTTMLDYYSAAIQKNVSGCQPVGFIGVQGRHIHMKKPALSDPH